MSATSIKEIIALKATFEPILIRARAQEMRQVRLMAFIGTKRVGWTLRSSVRAEY